MKEKDDYQRLMRAAESMKGWNTPSQIAAGLSKAGCSVSPQTIANWKTRGIAKPLFGTISRIVGCHPLWLEFGEGDMKEWVGTPTSTAMLTGEDQTARSLQAKETPLTRQDSITPLLRELLSIAESMNETGQQRLIGQAQLLASMHPKA